MWRACVEHSLKLRDGLCRQGFRFGLSRGSIVVPFWDCLIGILSTSHPMGRLQVWSYQTPLESDLSGVLISLGQP